MASLQLRGVPFSGTRLPSISRAASSGRQRAGPVVVRNDSALIVNTKGGGHAFIGLHLAKKLIAQGHKVTILNDGDQAKLKSKAPFSEYASLGAEVVWGSPTNPAAWPSAHYDVVYDNNGKDLDSCKPLIDHFKGKVSHYVFVGSAGAYVADPIEPMHVEGDKRKASAGHVAVESYLAESGLPYTVFQPLYIYGPHTAKDCEQWFVDRVIRDRPVPIPGPGIQLTTLSHVDDVAAMLALVPGNPSAVGQQYNVCSDRCITFDGIVRAVAKAAGKEAKIVHYDPAALKLAKGEGFPFRAGHFFASSDKAKRELGWAPRHTFLQDVDELVSEYIASGRAAKEIDFSADDRVLAAASAAAGAQ